MKVEISKSFPLPGPADVAWSVLQDVEAVASCMPGATLTERVDASHYKGTVGVKLGPASLSFRGEIEVQSLDAAQRALHLVGRGTDSSGTSGASMDLQAHIEPAGDASSQLVGKSEVSMSGKVATFGARLMGPVSDQVLQQFAANFATKVQAASASPPPSQAAPAATGPAPPTQPEPVKPLNGLALAWAMVRDWLGNFFARRA